MSSRAACTRRARTSLGCGGRLRNLPRVRLTRSALSAGATAPQQRLQAGAKFNTFWPRPAAWQVKEQRLLFGRRRHPCVRSHCSVSTRPDEHASTWRRARAPIACMQRFASYAHPPSAPPPARGSASAREGPSRSLVTRRKCHRLGRWILGIAATAWAASATANATGLASGYLRSLLLAGANATIYRTALELRA